MTQRQDRFSVWAYIITLWACLALVLGIAWHQPNRGPWWTILILVCLAIVAEAWCVTVTSSSTMSLSFTVHFASAILVGPAVAGMIAIVGVFFSDTFVQRRSADRVIFNMAQMGISATVCGLLYVSLGGSYPMDLADDAIPLVVASFAYLVVNDSLVTGVLALTGRSFSQEWVESIRDIVLPYVSMGPLGALVAYTFQSTPWSVIYFVPLVLVIYNGFKLYVTLQHETDHALVALADSIDKRDQYTFQHSQRVAALSGEIAEAMGMTARDVDLIVAAARVHDLGKIATDNRVLFKQSSLTGDERAVIQAHPVEGGELAGRFSMFRQGRRFIRHHHERWDGKGYPDGLAGEDIPKGARIIAVADSYDAMTSDRPYRRALPHEVALVELRRGAGTQFDPQVVDAFLARERSRQPKPAALVTEATESCSY